MARFLKSTPRIIKNKNMKYFNKIILASALVGSFTFSFAQKVDAKAKTILETVSKNYKAKKNTYFKFSYGTGNGKVSKTKTGIFYSTPSQYKLKIMGNEPILTEKKCTTFLKKNQEVTIAQPNGSEKALSPINYLDEYKTGYTVTLCREKWRSKHLHQNRSC